MLSVLVNSRVAIAAPAKPTAANAPANMPIFRAVISGLATEVCAAFPALSALREGYEVYVVVDACADFNPQITAVTVQRLAAAGAIVTTWVSVLAELSSNTQENGRYIAQFLSEHVGQYYSAMNNFLGVAGNADDVAYNVGFEGYPPIPQAGL